MPDVTLVSVAIALTLSVFRGSQGYPKGAPAGQCDGMTPSHYGGSPKRIDDKVPFSITATPYYHGGEVMNVTVSGTKSFKGLLLQARGTDNARVGTFSMIQGDKKALQLIDCGGPNTAVTHSARLDGNSVTVVWTAPSTDVGPIKFRVTVVQEYTTFYVGIESQAMSYKVVAGAGNDTSMAEGTATMPNISATPDDGNTAPVSLSASLFTVGLTTLVSVVA